jgi:hypothetical protein
MFLQLSGETTDGYGIGDAGATGDTIDGYDTGDYDLGDMA